MIKIIIIVAGGKGERMQSKVPKQFLHIHGRPTLMHTLEVFKAYDTHLKLVLVLPTNQLTEWELLCKKHAFTIEHQIVKGGETRFHSVKNGLLTVREPSLIAVHDGVRPFVSTDTIARCFDAAEIFGTAIPVINVMDSVRQIKDHESISVNRNDYKLVQTPQVFLSQILIDAYEQDFSESFTDDASVVESMGTKIHLVDGNRENFKITTEFDLKMAEALFC